jgi:phosphoesterase RecJ-like protein
MNLATTGSSVDAASDLLKRGVNLPDLSKRTMNNRSLATLKMWGKALERLQQTPYGLVYTVLTQEDLAAAGTDGSEGISNFLNSLDQETDARVILVLTQRDETTVKGSFRTTHPQVDVSKLAQAFGGGGHKKAAGFAVQGKLVETPGGWIIQK